jgi:hypothetical protein
MGVTETRYLYQQQSEWQGQRAALSLLLYRQPCQLMSAFVRETDQRSEIPGVGSSSFAWSGVFGGHQSFITHPCSCVFRGWFKISGNFVSNFREWVANSKNHKPKI